MSEVVLKLDANTKICCLFGNPVTHSLSPLVHNRGYETLDLNFVYVAFRVTDIEQAISAVRSLGIRGVSVTIPHKLTAVKYVDDLDALAKETGVLNTIVNEAGRLTGFNTDYEAALRTLSEKTPINGKRVVLLGAGATARSLAMGLKKRGAKLIILNRTRGQARELAKLVDAEGFGGLGEIAEVISADIVINATPVGMWPRTDETIVPREFLRSGAIVFDVNYNPRETRLISESKQAGCTVAYGYRMFLYQAARQFELFTGVDAPLAEMETVLMEALGVR